MNSGPRPPAPISADKLPGLVYLILGLLSVNAAALASEPPAQLTAFVAVEAADPSLESLARDARSTTMALLYNRGTQIRTGAVQSNPAKLSRAKEGLAVLRERVRDGLKGRELRALRRVAELTEQQFRGQAAALTPEEWSELERLYATLLLAAGERSAALERLELAANLQPLLTSKALAGRSRALRPLAERVLSARDGRPTGRLSIPDLPATAYVQVDGKKVAAAAGKGIELSAGQHLVRVVAEGSAIFAALVSVKAGKATTLRAELRPLPGDAERRRAQSAVLGAARVGDPIRSKDARALVRGAGTDRAVVLSLSRGPGGALLLRGAVLRASGGAAPLRLDLAPRSSLRRPLERALAAALEELFSPR